MKFDVPHNRQARQAQRIPAHQVLLNGYKICTDACNAFLALADVVDFIISAPRAHVEPSSLDNLVERFLELFVHAFGFEWMTPKFH